MTDSPSISSDMASMSGSMMSGASMTRSMGAGMSGIAAASAPVADGTNAGSVASVRWGLFTAAALWIVGAAFVL